MREAGIDTDTEHSEGVLFLSCKIQLYDFFVGRLDPENEIMLLSGFFVYKLRL